MDLRKLFGSERAEHEPDHPTPAARPILIVEDDPAFGRLLFPMRGVRDNASAAEAAAYSLLKEQSFRLVVPVTGRDERVDANERAAAGVNPIIMKPVNREQFFEMFETGDPRVRQFALEASCPRS